MGDFCRFSTPDRLVSYLDLNPRVRQSGGQPAQHGRITKQGRAHARGMLVEAAWAASKTPGPLRSFNERIKARRGMQVAVVATARKLAVPGHVAPADLAVQSLLGWIRRAQPASGPGGNAASFSPPTAR